MVKEIDAFIEAAEQLAALKQTIQKQKDTGARLQTVYDNFGRIADEVGKLPIRLKGITDKAEATALEINSACAQVEALTKSVPEIVTRIENSDIGRSVAALTTEMAANRAELLKFNDLCQRLESAMEAQSKLQAQWNHQLLEVLKKQSERVVDLESRVGLSIEKTSKDQALIVKNFADVEVRHSGSMESLSQSVAAVHKKQSDSELMLSNLIASSQASHSRVFEKISVAYKDIARSCIGTNESLASVRQEEIEILNKLLSGMREQDNVLSKIEAKKTSLF